ncbi:tetratricopeptide repeat protein [Helicobacter sp. T3_23-1056]
MRKMQNPTSKKPTLKRAILICGILASLVNTGLSALNEQEWEWAIYECLDKSNKSVCQALIDNGLPSIMEECTKDDCYGVGLVYHRAGHYKEAISCYEKAIAFGDNRGYGMLGVIYESLLNDYFNAKKYFEIACNKVGDLQSDSCYDLGVMYYERQGVRQDYHKAHELYKKACDMKNAMACNDLGVLYDNGKGVKQNLSIAKQYYDKACDLGDQVGCDNYKKLDSAGVQ